MCATLPSDAKEVRSNLSERAYLQMVHRAVDDIYAGDVFQVNLVQRLTYPVRDDSVWKVELSQT
jgi:anthranilate/para-aminobenzoate synthase component I